MEAAGGKVLHKGGSHRVMGLLAMSRAIGDHFLRPFIVADPEVSCHLRQLDDEVLLIATDGLWDVFTNDDAMALAIRWGASAGPAAVIHTSLYGTSLAFE